MQNSKPNFYLPSLVVLCLIVGGAGCAETGPQLNDTQTGALAGTALGAGLGAIIGDRVGHTGSGVAIGAAAGALGGALIGRQGDRQNSQLSEQDERLRRQDEEIRRQRRELEEMKRGSSYRDGGGNDPYYRRGRDQDRFDYDSPPSEYEQGRR